MTYARFTTVPWAGFKSTEEWPFVSIHCDGPLSPTRRSLSPYPRRRWTWEMKLLSDRGESGDDRTTINAFFLTGRQLGAQAFLIRDPKDVRQTALNIGTGDGVETVFYLPTTASNAAYPHFPYDDSTTVAYVDGVAIATANRTIDTDLRKVTFSSPPANTKPVTLSYDFYRLAMFESPSLEWTKGDSVSIWTEVAPSIVEIVRE